ncbi:MAG: hypothetical protein ACPG5U_00475 [Planktomarina sp.]
MHRPLIIVAALIAFGALTFFLSGGVEPTDTTTARLSTEITAPRQSVVNAELVEDVVSESMTPIQIPTVEDAPGVIDVDEAAPMVAANPEMLAIADVSSDVGGMGAVVVVTDTLADAPVVEIDNHVANIAAVQDLIVPQRPVAPAAEVPIILGAPITVETQAPSLVASLSSLNPVADTTPVLSSNFDSNPTRLRAPAVIAVTSVSPVVGPTITTQQPAPFITERPAEEVAVFASRSSGALLLTATALGADGVLRPSAVGSLAGIALSAPAPTIAPQPAAIPNLVVAPTFQSTRIATIQQPADTLGALDFTTLAPSPAPAPTIDLTTVAPSLSISAVPTTPVAPVVVEPKAFITTHRVRHGESLTGLAIRYYGDREAFVHIFEENRDVLKRPTGISIGQLLRIPVVAGYN